MKRGWARRLSVCLAFFAQIPLSYAADEPRSPHEAGLSLRISGSPEQTLALHAALEAQLKQPVRSRQVASKALAEEVARGGAEPLTAWVDLSDRELTKLMFTRDGELITQRIVPRYAASDVVHFEDLSLIIRTIIGSDPSLVPSPTKSDPPPEPAPSEAPLNEGKSGEESATKRAPPNQAKQLPKSTQTPWRFDFNPAYTVTRFAESPKLLFGIGLGFELVGQKTPLDMGVRIANEGSTAFEFVSSRPLASNTRYLFTLGLEKWLPSRFGAGLTLQRAGFNQSRFEEEDLSFVLTGMGELRLPFGDRVDGVLGSYLDWHLGDPTLYPPDGEPVHQHQVRFTTYLGVAITALGNR